MKRYFFHISHERMSTDREGSLFADPEAARRAAVEVLAALLKDEGETFWETPSAKVTVEDEDGVVLCSLETVGR